MPFTVRWDNPKQTLIRSESSGVWTWEEYHHNIDSIVEMIGAVSHSVDILVVQTKTSIAPKGNHFPHYNRVIRVLPDNHGQIIMVVKNRIGRGIMNATMQFFPNFRDKIVAVDSLDKAYKYLAEKA